MAHETEAREEDGEPCSEEEESCTGCAGINGGKTGRVSDVQDVEDLRELSESLCEELTAFGGTFARLREKKQKIEVISNPRRPLCTELVVRSVIFEWNESEEWQVEARRRFCEAVETHDRVFRLQSLRTLVWISVVPAKDRCKSVEQELRTA